MIMQTDLTYQYFQTALWEWIDKTKRDGDAPQKLLSLKMGITEGTVSKYVNPKREKPIPYEMQVAFANACGHSYLSFVQLGKNIVDAKSLLTPVIDLQSEATKKHQIVIEGFEDKDRAIEINEALVEIENFDIDEYDEICDTIMAKRDKIRKKREMQEQKKRNVAI